MLGTGFFGLFFFFPDYYFLIIFPASSCRGLFPKLPKDASVYRHFPLRLEQSCTLKLIWPRFPGLILMNSQLNPTFHLCRHWGFIPHHSMSSRQLKQAGGTGRLPKTQMLFSGQKKIQLWPSSAWVLVSLFPFVAGFCAVNYSLLSQSCLVVPAELNPFTREGRPSISRHWPSLPCLCKSPPMGISHGLCSDPIISVPSFWSFGDCAVHPLHVSGLGHTGSILWTSPVSLSWMLHWGEHFQGLTCFCHPLYS